eukprot:GEMP01000654.1.p1 GENE.GEMP01000654.1~~GEMP01000654.1.p1  ORF type:complete len:1788 (+),score=338.78 GEMP01000654.1:165-5528(+)
MNICCSAEAVPEFLTEESFSRASTLATSVGVQSEAPTAPPTVTIHAPPSETPPTTPAKQVPVRTNKSFPSRKTLDLRGYQLQQELDQKDFWEIYEELVKVDPVPPAHLIAIFMEHLRGRLPKTTLSPAQQKHMELFLDPYWGDYLEQFPEKFPLENPETYAPVVLDNLVVSVGYLKEKDRKGIVDFVRRKVVPPFRCTADDIEDQVNETISLMDVSKSLALEALKGGASNPMSQLEQYGNFVNDAVQMTMQSAFVRQPGYQSERVRLTGDLHNLAERQREVILLLPQPQGVTKLHLKQVAKAFGGGLVFFVTPFSENEKLPSVVVKLGRVDENAPAVVTLEKIVSDRFRPSLQFDALNGGGAPQTPQWHPSKSPLTSVSSRGGTTPGLQSSTISRNFSGVRMTDGVRGAVMGAIVNRVVTFSGFPSRMSSPAITPLEVATSMDSLLMSTAMEATEVPRAKSNPTIPVSHGQHRTPKSTRTTSDVDAESLADNPDSQGSTRRSKLLRYSKHRGCWMVQGGGSSKDLADVQHDESSHIDLHSVLVEILERNLWGFTFNTPNDGPTVRRVQTVNLAKMYKIQHLINKAVINRHELKVDVEGVGRKEPLDFEEIDPDGKIRKSLVGKKYEHLSITEFFTQVSQQVCDKFSSVQIVTGRGHGDLHGGNLLIDSHGLAWLIDFATAAPGGRHVLYDLTKLLMSSIMLYPHEYDAFGDENTNIGALFQVMAALPRNTHVIPESAYRLIEPRFLQFAWEISATLRHAAAKYEADDNLDSPYPWVIAMLSWCLRISTYREPELPQLRICLYGALCMGARILYMDDIQSSPPWLIEASMVYASARASSPLHTVDCGWEVFNRELQRYLVSVATKDSWLTDPITRQQTQVMDMQVSCTYYESGAIIPPTRSGTVPPNPPRTTMSGKRARDALNLILERCLSSSSKVEASSGRLLVVSESGMGKTLLTKQLTSQAAQMQLIADSQTLFGTPKRWASDNHNEVTIDAARRLCRRMVPIRVPLVEFSKLYRKNPDCLKCDPNTDFLALWAEWKFGKTGATTRLIKMARQASVIAQQMNRRIIRDDDNLGYNASECFLMCVFDGLDECANYWAQCLQFLTSFVESEPRHIVVLTARPWEETAISKLQEQHNFSAFRISPLSRQQSEAFCRRKLQMLSTSEDTMERIIRIVCYSSEFKEMCSIPLILSLLLHFHRISISNLKNHMLSKTKVYRHAVHLMLYQVGANKVAARDVAQHDALIQLNKCRMLLRHGAWIAHRDRALTFGSSDRRPSIMRMELRSRTAPVFWAELRIIAEQKGLVDPLQRLIAATAAGHTPLLCGDHNQFRFARLAYEELLCGEFFACVLQQDQSLTHKLFGDNLELLHDESWHEPILHCLSSLGDSTMFNWLYSYILPDKDQRSKCCKSRKELAPGSNGNVSHELLLKAAAQFGSKMVVEALLQADCSPHCCYKGGNTPLHLAAQYGHTPVVNTLVEFKAFASGQVALNYNFRTPIQEAILNGHVDVYRALTRYSNSRGFPTEKAIRDFPSSIPATSKTTTSFSRNSSDGTSSNGGGVDVIRYHLKKGELSPLIVSAYDGSFRVVEAILEQLPEKSADVRCPGSARASALCFAAENGRPNVVRLLLDARADCKFRYGPNNCGVLFWPSFAGYLEVVRLLIEANAPLYKARKPASSDADYDVDAHLTDTLSPLHAAAATGQVAIVELLLNYGADPFSLYKPLLLRPMHLAAYFGSDEIYNLLVSRGDTGRADRGSTVGPEDLRHLYECPPGSIPKHLQKLSKNMEKLF